MRITDLAASDEIAVTATPKSATYRLGYQIAFGTPTFPGAKTFHVTDFGAVGDGVTDDFSATGMLGRGYDSFLYTTYRDILWRGAWTSLLMQSPFGELPTGYRSSHNIWNEAEQAVIFEIYATATAHAQAGRMAEAGAFKRAARLSLQSIRNWSKLADSADTNCKVTVLEETPQRVRFVVDYPGVRQQISIDETGVTVEDTIELAGVDAVRVHFPMLISDGKDETAITMDKNTVQMKLDDRSVRFTVQEPQNAVWQRSANNLNHRNGIVEDIFAESTGKRLVYRITAD